MKNEVDTFVLATKLYQPSYISMESTLSYFGIIPEVVFTTTSITTRKTNFFTNKIFGNFSYQKIKKGAFGGFETHQTKNISYNLAVPEKSLVDFFYLNRHTLDGARENFEGYRFNKNFKYNKNNLEEFAKIFNNKKVEHLTTNFIRYYTS